MRNYEERPMRSTQAVLISRNKLNSFMTVVTTRDVSSNLNVKTNKSENKREQSCAKIN